MPSAAVVHTFFFFNAALFIHFNSLTKSGERMRKRELGKADKIQVGLETFSQFPLALSN